MNIKDKVSRKIKNLTAYSSADIACGIKLDANENAFDMDGRLRKEFVSAAYALRYNRYPGMSYTSLRAALAELNGLSPENIIAANGSDELIGCIMQAFTDADDSVIYFEPSFEMYRIIALANKLNPVAVELDGRFELDYKSFASAARRSGAKMVFLASPNNPTGNSFKKAAVMRIIREFPGLVVIDEAYSDFSGMSYLDAVKKHPNVIILKSFSKSYSMAGLRFGYLIAARETAEVINRVRLPYNLNVFTALCAETALRHRKTFIKNIAVIRRERDRMAAALKKIKGLKPYPSDANFILFSAGDRAAGIYKSLAEKGILIRYFNSGGALRGCLRVSVGKKNENDRFLRTLKVLMKGL